MNWFRHETDAHQDAQLQLIRQDFGNEGLAIYWLLLERVAGATPAYGQPHDFSLTLPVAEWCSYLQVRRPKLGRYLVAAQQRQLCYSIVTGNLLTIGIPKLAKIRDNYSRRRSALEAHTTSTEDPQLRPVEKTKSQTNTNTKKERKTKGFRLIEGGLRDA